MKSNKIVSDILNLDKPESFQQISINDILKKHIYAGMLEKDVVTIFKGEGFSINEKDAKKPSQKNFHAIYYVDESISTPAQYKIVVSISVVDGKVSEFSGVYLKHMY